MSSFYIVRASRWFMLGQKAAAGFPIVVSADGVVVETIASFLRARFVYQNAGIGTLCDEAYILREWWQYLARQRVAPHEVSEKLFLLWIRDQERRMENARVQRKISLVHQFHRFLSKSDPTFENSTVFMSEFPKFKYPRSSLRSRPGRPTPDTTEVEKVLDVLSHSSNPYLAARDWLLGMWIVETGLRREGVSSIRLATLEASLKEEGILLTNLLHCCRDPAEADRIRASLFSLKDSGREAVFIAVVEKGRKWRTVPVPIGLMLLTLEFIWNERDKLLAEYSARYTEARAEGAVWISLKTGRPLGVQSIGDRLKHAFNRAGVAGSGHRLRAYFACSLVWRLYRRAKSRSGAAWEANMVLLQAAEILGHNNIETLRPYLNRVLREDMFEGLPVPSRTLG